MITSVELGNFLSHKKSEINFDNGVTVFIGENGSGKSSVIDGITF
jgi:exonuclease SbcC